MSVSPSYIKKTFRNKQFVDLYPDGRDSCFFVKHTVFEKGVQFLFYPSQKLTISIEADTLFEDQDEQDFIKLEPPFEKEDIEKYFKCVNLLDNECTKQTIVQCKDIMGIPLNKYEVYI